MNKTAPGETEQFLTFDLDGEIYAISISQVREVLDLEKITRIPKMPDFVRGMINLRGGVVPIIDLRQQFELPKGEETVNTCIIIIELVLEGESTLLGAIADSVREVLTIERESIIPSPQIGTRIKTEFIRGMSKHDNDFIIILEIAKIFSEEELAIVHNSEKTSSDTEETAELSEELIAVE